MAERYIFGNTVSVEADLDSPGEIDEAIALLEEIRGGTHYHFSGESFYCDTCGSDSPKGHLYVFNSGVYLKTEYGCFGGYSGSDPGEIREELEHIRGFMSGDFEEALKELEQ